MGVLGGDNAGFPNGRRLTDDVVDIEEQAVGRLPQGQEGAARRRRQRERHAVPGALPVRPTPHQGYDEHEGDELIATRREAGSAGPLHPPEDDDQQASDRTAAVSPSVRRALGGCSTGRRARPDALAAAQSVEDFKAGFALNASSASLVESLQATLAANEGDEHSWRCSASPTSSAPATPATRASTRKAGAALNRAIAPGRRTTRSRSAGSARSRSRATASRSRSSWAEKALALSPSTARHYGVIGDARDRARPLPRGVPRLRRDEQRCGRASPRTHASRTAAS